MNDAPEIEKRFEATKIIKKKIVPLLRKTQCSIVLKERDCKDR